MKRSCTLFALLCLFVPMCALSGVKTGLENAGMDNWKDNLRESCVKPALKAALHKATTTETYQYVVSNINVVVTNLEAHVRPYYNQIVREAKKAQQAIEEAQTEYAAFKTQFEQMRQKLEESQTTLSGMQGEQDRNELEQRADADKKQVEEETKEVEQQEKKDSAETLSEAAQKAVDEERKKRREAAEAKAIAEGKDPSEAKWDDLTDEEIAKIADEADGLETVSDEDQAESDELKVHLL